jgi:hypothetical protein
MVAHRSRRTLAAVLGDPLVQLMMRADHVDPQALTAEFQIVAERLGRAGRPVSAGRSWRAAGRRQSLCRA